MKLTVERISRYLSQQKKLNDYLMKIVSKDRQALILLSKAQCGAFETEDQLRNLLEYLTNG